MRLGDIDGDGRADYIAISSNGEIKAWRHGGVGVAASNWQDIGIMMHSGSITSDPAGFRFVSQLLLSLGYHPDNSLLMPARSI